MRLIIAKGNGATAAAGRLRSLSGISLKGCGGVVRGNYMDGPTQSPHLNISKGRGDGGLAAGSRLRKFAVSVRRLTAPLAIGGAALRPVANRCGFLVRQHNGYTNRQQSGRESTFRLASKISLARCLSPNKRSR